MFKSKEIVFGFLLGFFLIGSVQGASSSQQLQKGYKLLTQKKFEAALGQFQAAGKADPKNGEALFFQGVALNRLGRFGEAGQKLDEAEKLGSHPEWNFERGWAHLGMKEWKEAIRSFKAFERKNPGRGQTHEFMGRAYFGLGDYDRAEKYLTKAIEKDPRLKKTAHTYLAAIPRKKGAEKSKPWGLNAGLAGFYNTNVINLANGRALPRDISRQYSGFGSGVLAGRYRFDFSDNDQLTLGHQFFSNLYEVSENVNMIDNFSTIAFRHRFDEKRAFGLNFSNEFTVIQTAKFRNQIGVQPVFGWRLSDWMTAEAGYAFALGEYFFPSNAAQNRDANSHTLGLNNYFSIPKTDWRLRLGYSHLWNLADGGDFDYEANAIVFGASHPLFWKLTGDLSLSHSWNRYDNINSLSGALVRSDDVTNLFGQINFPVVGKLKGYARGGYTRNFSNIGTFNYRAHQGGLGFALGI